MIPIILFIGLSPQEFVYFQIVQTILDFLFVYLLIFFVLKRLNDHAYNRNKVLLTALGIEGIHAISAFMWYFFVFYAIGGFIIELLFLFIIPYLFIYLLYTPYSESPESESKKKTEQPNDQSSFLSTGRAFLLYLCSVLPAFFLSAFLTSTLFNLLGMHNYFIFS